MKISSLWSKMRFVGLLLVVLALPVLGRFGRAAALNTPRFNYLPGDLEFLSGRNVTAGQNDYNDPVTAAADETVRVRIYYHNGASQENGEPGAAAINTRVKINLPTAEANSHQITGVLSADNAAAVSGTIVDGQEVGQPNFRLDTATGSTLETVAGSVKWFPNRSTSPVSLLNGQTGDELFGPNGLLLGDIDGCWQFSGFVTFDLKIKVKAGQPLITRAKSATNLTQGEVDATTVKAKPGDRIRYLLSTANSGTAATEVRVTDDIGDILVYADLVEAVGTLTGTTLDFGNLLIAPNQVARSEFTVVVKPASQWPAGGDLVMTNVYGNSVDVPLLPPAEPRRNLTIDKAVRDLTRGDQDFGFEVRQVSRGDTIEFKLIVRNTGETNLSELRLRDRHDAYLEYQRGSAILWRDGATAAVTDDAVGDGLKLDRPLAPGEKIELTYRMKIGGGAPDGVCQTNRGLAQAAGVGEVSDTAQACVTVPTVSAPTPTPPVQSPSQPQPSPAAPVLPVTGPAGAFMALIGAFGTGTTGWRLARAKRAWQRAQSTISVL